ncbi:MAG: hypothetical protein AAF609_14910 [Cyanobacteria bacterium P01_C01_bin.120]
MPESTLTAAPVSTRYSPGLVWFKTQAVETDAGVLVPTLLFTTGTITDASGNTYTFEKKDLNRIVRATKKYFNDGGNIHLFDSNHDLDDSYSAKDIIGRLAVDEGLVVEEITEENLPDDRLSDLIGQFAIYGHLYITRADAVERYKATLLKPISIAFDPSGEFTDDNKYAIYEVSAVPWGAVRGAMLFGRFPASEFADVAKPKKDNPTHRIFALTLDGAMAERQGRWTDYSDLDEKLGELFWMATDVFYSIRNTTEEELQGRDCNTLLREAINDLRDKLQEVLGVRRDAPPTVSVNSQRFAMTLASMLNDAIDGMESDEMSRADIISRLADEAEIESGTVNQILNGDITCPPEQRLRGFARVLDVTADALIGEAENDGCSYGETSENQKGKGMDEEIKALKAEVAELKTRAERSEQRADNAEQFASQLQHERKVSDRVQLLRDWSAKLVRLGKLKPVALEEWFPDKEQHSSAVVRFAKPAVDDQISGEAQLNEIEAALKFAEKYNEPQRFGSRLGQVALDDDPLASGGDNSADDEASQKYAEDFRQRNPIKRSF